MAYFNPRAPCGARRRALAVVEAMENISIHAPLAGRDSKSDEFSSANLRNQYKFISHMPRFLKAPDAAYGVSYAEYALFTVRTCRKKSGYIRFAIR